MVGMVWAGGERCFPADPSPDRSATARMGQRRLVGQYAVGADVFWFATHCEVAWIPNGHCLRHSGITYNASIDAFTWDAPSSAHEQRACDRLLIVLAAGSIERVIEWSRCFKCYLWWHVRIGQPLGCDMSIGEQYSPMVSIRNP